MDNLEERESELVDLSATSLQELTSQPAEILEPYLKTIRGQVKTARFNLGNQPPGRVD